MSIENICKLTKQASLEFATVDGNEKNRILTAIKNEIAKRKEDIISANELDMANAKKRGRDKAFLDRLFLDNQRIDQMCKGVDAVIKLEDPVGLIVEEYQLENGLFVQKIRAPLGSIGIIFEARPNVALDASILCIKSGNGVVLRGSRESAFSVKAIVEAIKFALKAVGSNPNLVALVESPDREATIEMLKYDKYIDVVIPRGGEGLKKVVLENASMAVLASAGGNCHTYISQSANIEMAKKIIVNAKVSRPGVCNATETLLIDSKIADKHTKVFCDMLKDLGVEIRVADNAKKYCDYAKVIKEEEYYLEYHDMIIKVIIVDGVEQAIAHINKYGTGHSDAIITQDEDEVFKFSKGVDSAAVYINASTRFTDGFELGLGAEMGISTQKLHVRGPIGLKELTSVKYVIIGNGQIR